MKTCSKNRSSRNGASTPVSSSRRNRMRPVSPSLNRTKRQYCGSGFTSTTSQCIEQTLRSCQRLNFRRRRFLAAESPVFQQFLSMYHRPFQDQVQCPARQLAFNDLQGADADRSFKVTISSVKVWRWVVIEEHSDQDPIGRADRRHSRQAGFAPGRVQKPPPADRKSTRLNS